MSYMYKNKDYAVHAILCSGKRSFAKIENHCDKTKADSQWKCPAAIHMGSG